MMDKKDDYDPFWDIQLHAGSINHVHHREGEDSNNGNKHDWASWNSANNTTWLAPSEREGLNYASKQLGENDGNSHENALYEWIDIPLTISTTATDNNIIRESSCDLAIRSIKSSVSLMESYVGEEIWEAAILFSNYLCQANNYTMQQCDSNKVLPCDINVKNKCIVELGGGCGLLSMCCSALGASKVLCTDYLADVMDNLAFNLNHNLGIIEKHAGQKVWLKCAVLDWKKFISNDVAEAEWIGDGDIVENDCAQLKSVSKQDVKDDEIHYSRDSSSLNADMLIGSALIYSAPGAFFCADTIHHYFEKHKTKEMFLLQMTERPGFDRFLYRLQHWSIDYQAFEIPKAVYDVSQVTTPREAFRLFHLKSEH